MNSDGSYKKQGEDESLAFYSDLGIDDRIAEITNDISNNRINDGNKVKDYFASGKIHAFLILENLFLLIVWLGNFLPGGSRICFLSLGRWGQKWPTEADGPGK